LAVVRLIAVGLDGIVFGPALGKQFKLSSVDLALIFKVSEEGVRVVFEVGELPVHLEELEVLAAGVDVDRTADSLELCQEGLTRSTRLCS
jgi:hypothetical protein